MMMYTATAATLAFLLQSASAATSTSLRKAAAAAPPMLANDAPRRLQTPAYDGDLRFHEVTFIASHNAHANLELAGGDMLLPLGANQEFTIYKQLADSGVRGLMIDLQLNEDEAEPLRLTHGSGFISLDYGGARSELGTNLIPFLEQDPNAIISFFLETDGDTGSDGATVRSKILGHLKDIFSVMTVNGMPLKDMTFKYNDGRWQNHDDWPKLEELRSSGQRIFVFTDRSDIADQEYGFMYNRDVLQENNFDGIDRCDELYRWGQGKISLPFNDYWTRLFLMNHFSGYSGPDSRDDTVGQNLIGGGTNGWGVLYRRVLDCMSTNGGFKPNFIALDWVIQSQEAREVSDYLNFGGRLGTGQTCTEDSHCATSSCNTNVGLCQCQQCLPNSLDDCLGCESGEYCANMGAGMNVCQQKLGGFEANPVTPVTVFDSANRFYCGSNFTQASGNCYTNTPCPTGAPGVCPNEGDTCYGGIVCIAPPTISPTSSIQPTLGATSPKPSVSPSSAKPTTSPVESGPGNNIVITDAPTPIPSKTAATFESFFYCGTNYTVAAANCAEAVKCPGGQEECPVGETCYFLNGIVCPTPPPSEKPSESTSAVPSPKPVFGPGTPAATQTLCGTGFESTAANCQSALPCTSASDCAFLGVEFACFPVVCDSATPPPVSTTTPPPVPPSGTETTLCGTDSAATAANCQNAFPCTSASDCAFLGVEFTCFTVECDSETTPPPVFGGIQSPTTKPTPPILGPGGGLLPDLGFTKSPTGFVTSPPMSSPIYGSPTTNPTTSPSSRPTEAPFDFSNKFFCGSDFDDARENCYKVNEPCPTGAPEACPGDHQCYSGVTCTAPPTALPTTSPTPGPTNAPQVGTPGVSGPGGRPNDMPAPAPQYTNPPFDDSAWAPFPPPSGAAFGADKFMSGMIVWSTIVVFAFAGLLLI